jgi:DNA-binding MarR family transcriptional regulator
MSILSYWSATGPTWASAGVAGSAGFGVPDRPGCAGHQKRSFSSDASAGTMMVRTMETAGHVGRTRDLADRRRVTLHMQSRALELATAFFVPLGKLMHEAAEDFSDGDLARATSVIRQMAAAVTKAREQASG